MSRFASFFRTTKNSLCLCVCAHALLLACVCVCVCVCVSPAHLWLGEHCCLLPTTRLYRVKALWRMLTTDRAWTLDSTSVTIIRRNQRLIQFCSRVHYRSDHYVILFLVLEMRCFLLNHQTFQTGLQQIISLYHCFNSSSPTEAIYYKNRKIKEINNEELCKC